jgi:hypothetical protein
MYSYLYRQIVGVAASIILLNTVIETIVANTYPFQTGNVWANWAALTFGSLISVGAVTWAFIDNSDQKKMLGEALGCVGATTALVAVVAVLFAFMGIDGKWVELIWAATVVNLIVGAGSVGLIYLIIPRSRFDHREYNDRLPRGGLYPQLGLSYEEFLRRAAA